MKKTFKYSALAELKKDLKQLNPELPVNKDLNILKNRVEYKNIKIANALAVHPMEGADAEDDGTPSDLTKRRYRRYAQGGAGLIWFEALAINKIGRANIDQLYLNKENLPEFKNLIKMINKEADPDIYGDLSPYLVAQLTHSGRFGENNQVIFSGEILDSAANLEEEDFHILSDQEIDELKNDYLNAAKLAKEAGFDAVDIKSCHRYLLSEMLAAHKRDGRYGGSYENRTRFLKSVIKIIKKEVDIDLAVRLNIYDAIPYPYGWSTAADGRKDLSESKKLLRELDELGVEIVNTTASTPYLKPHVNRPYDQGSYQPPESPLNGVIRLLELNKFAQNNFKGIVVGTGFSWLRQFAPYIAGGMIEKNWMTIAGFGRQAFAYPNFARDIIKNNNFDKSKVCITCSKCAELKAAHKKSGCVIRDKEIYLPVYKELMAEQNK